MITVGSRVRIIVDLEGDELSPFIDKVGTIGEIFDEGKVWQSYRVLLDEPLESEDDDGYTFVERELEVLSEFEA